MAAKRRTIPTQRSQLDAFSGPENPGWPVHREYPYNHSGLRVETVVDRDLAASSDPLIITGYTSLPRIIKFLAQAQQRGPENSQPISRMRILIGHDPVARTTRSFKIVGDLSQDIADHWLESGVSLLLSGEIVRALNTLESDHVLIRSSGRTAIHAKIYATEEAVTGGSSNYSDAGLTWQIEANWRFDRGEEQRYLSSVRLAEAIWELGVDYKDALRQLLSQLLRAVTWEEALLRGAAELLEGEWAKRYVSVEPYGAVARLWPSQEAGVAQAMWVIANVGSVLIADAAGSGKTKLGSYVIRAIQQRNWRTGRMRQDVPVVVSPPTVRSNWIKEGMAIGCRPDIHSHGVLSAKASKRKSAAIEAIRQAQVVAIDEAHNFHNRGSRRTRGLYANMADHVVLFTATPINRGPLDLLPIIDLLGADNFDDATLTKIQTIWKRVRGKGRRHLSPEERATITGAIRQFTVRRTKADFNRMIAEEPERYRDATGRPCRYPDHSACTFGCGASDGDRRRAGEIRHLARRLIGVAFFRKPLRMPKHLVDEGRDEAAYLEQRLRSASALAVHHVAATLRSSRAALLEHLLGTEVACAKCGFAALQKARSGNQIGNHRANAGKPPGSALSIQVPPWLVREDAHREASAHDRKLYEQMAQLADELSDGREERKVDLLVSLLSTHDKVIAFDSRPVTLMDLQNRLRNRGQMGVLLAVGGQDRARTAVMNDFAANAESGAHLALCSDALAEGLNLQGASAVVLLDMPSVIRIAEQRVGRIDRMDSPHDKIEVHWPDDSSEYALRTDELFLDRHRHVEELLGSNLELPDLFRRAAEGVAEQVTPTAYAQGLRDLAEARLLDGIADAFSPVRHLIEGEDPLVDPSDYRHFRKSQARVLTSIGVVHSKCEWSLYAVAGTSREAPRWVFLDHSRIQPELDLAVIEKRLRQLIVRGSVSYRINEDLSSRLADEMQILRRSERDLVPKRKQRALIELSYFVKVYTADAQDQGDLERLDALQSIQRLLTPDEQGTTDFSRLADWWLDIVRPRWYEHIASRSRRNPALLKHLRPVLKASPIPTEQLMSVRSVASVCIPIDQRISAAVLGVSDTASLELFAGAQNRS